MAGVLVQCGVLVFVKVTVVREREVDVLVRLLVRVMMNEG